MKLISPTIQDTTFVRNPIQQTRPDKNKIQNLREKICENKEEMNLVFSCLIGIAKKSLINGKFTHTKDEGY